MNARIGIFVAFLALVSGKDILEGDTQAASSKKIYDEKHEANPAIWRQVQNVTVIATDTEVISGILITDLRPEKDGDAKIVEGGVGQKNVTIELKSPTVLRGYDFQIQVFAAPDGNNNFGGINHPGRFGNGNLEGFKPNQDKINPTSTIDKTEDENKFTTAPRTIGDDFSHKSPVPLTTEVNIKDNNRNARSAQNLKTNDEQTTTKKPNNDPKSPSIIGSQNITPNPVNPDQTKDDVEHRNNKPSTEQPKLSAILPGILNKSAEIQSNIDEDLKNQHRHVRDTTPPSSQIKDGKNTPKGVNNTATHFDDSIPFEVDTEKKDGTTEKNQQASTIPSNVDTKNVQKIPVPVIPKWQPISEQTRVVRDSDKAIVTKLGEDKMPTPHVPAVITNQRNSPPDFTTVKPISSGISTTHRNGPLKGNSESAESDEIDEKSSTLKPVKPAISHH